MASTRQGLLDAIPQIADEKLRAELVREVGSEWAEYSPRRTLEWFDSITFENPRLNIAAVNLIYSAAVKRGRVDRTTAVDWAWRHLPDDQRTDFLFREIEGDWRNSDPEAVDAWLAKHEIEIHR